MLIIRFRFLDIALSRLEPVLLDGATLATDGARLIYGPKHILRCFKSDHDKPARDYLHVLLHCIFSHMFTGDLQDSDLWDLACDIAVESTLNDLGLYAAGDSKKAAQRPELERIRADVKMLTAEKIYHHFLVTGITDEEAERLGELFRSDDHSGWHASKPVKRESEDTDEQGRDNGDEPDPPEDGPSLLLPPLDLEEEWKDIAEKVQEALETIFKGQGDTADGLIQNLKAVTREKYDYTTFLKKFSVLGETLGVNDEEFDYVFYTYGLTLYKNMPLVEPLEYKESRRIKEFVVAIDTSASTSGELVQKFLQKTYNILKSTESFFTRVNIHIIQCDAEVQEHVKISSEEDFDRYMSRMEIHGLGGTDFRPVFELVDGLIDAGEFSDLKGLIYFTDGYGTFPEHKPGYQTAFVFLDDEYNDPDVPPWAIRLVLQDDEI
jgi:predicted metal-dependent peptidase